MRAIVQRAYGSPELLELAEVARPVAGAGQVLVRVHAASLHPDVWHVVTGRPTVLRLMGAGLRRPKVSIPGTDMAGVVEALGAGVTTFRVGDPVFGETVPGRIWSHGGAFAEYVSVPGHLLARKPECLTFEEAASVPASGDIVLQNLPHLDRWTSGKRVLVNGAGGGVGTMALQLLKAQGAHVTAVDRGRKLEMLLSLGADAVVDADREDFVCRGERYDLLFDVLGTRPISELRHALHPDGKYVPIGHEGFGASGNRIFGLLPHFLRLMIFARNPAHPRTPASERPTKAEAIQILRGYLERGVITPRIDSTFRLEEVRAAFRRMTDGQTLGKVVLTPLEREG